MLRHLRWAVIALALHPQFALASQVRSLDAFLGSVGAPRGNMTTYESSAASKGNKTMSQNSTKSNRQPNIVDVDLGRTTITTTTSTLFPPDPLLGSVQQADTDLTMKVIKVGMESALEKFKKANARLAKMTCEELDNERKELEEAYEKLRDQAMLMVYEASRANALKSLDIQTEKETKFANSRKELMKKSDLAKNTRDEKVSALEAVKMYDTATILHMNALEQYALKCGANDQWCEIGDTANNNKWAKLQKSTAEVDAIFTEAGWLRNDAVGEYATVRTKQSAELRWGEAMRHVGEVWTDRKSLTTGLEVVTAACGLRPPNDFDQPKQKCNLKPQDPMMQALLRDNPKEFVRRWKELIGKKAGVTPDKVVVNVAGCF